MKDVVSAFLDEIRPNEEKTIDEILAPIWEGWRQSGMTEEQIDELLHSELQAVRRERRDQREKP